MTSDSPNERPEIIARNPDCKGDDCPTVYRPTDGMVPVQGYIRTDMATPEGEAVIEIPLSILLEAARVLEG